ncbi:MAG: pentapeptide repeat-containing protein [Candidatus Saccharimonadales bacterium]
MSAMSKLSGVKVGVIVGAFVASVFGAGATNLIFAAIPNSSTGRLEACFNNTTGALRVIDVQGSSTCSGGETAVSWNQKSILTDVTGGNLSGTVMNYWDLRGTDFSGTDLSSADINGVDFRYSTLTNTNFISAGLRKANFSGTNLSTADLTDSYLTNANLSNSTLTSGSLRVGDGEGLNAAGADFSGTTLQGYFINSNFSGADLSNTSLIGVFAGAQMSTATLTGATWDTNTTCPDGTRAYDHGDTCIYNL